MKPLSTSMRLRSCVRRASARSVCARETWARAAVTLAWAVSTTARAASTSAWAERTRYSKVSGSITAISWPALTSELKSTYRSLICPETWVPTVTCVTGLTAPLADTADCSGPRSTLPVRYCTSLALPRWLHHQPRPTASSKAPTPAAMS